MSVPMKADLQFGAAISQHHTLMRNTTHSISTRSLALRDTPTVNASVTSNSSNTTAPLGCTLTHVWWEEDDDAGNDPPGGLVVRCSNSSLTEIPANIPAEAVSLYV